MIQKAGSGAPRSVPMSYGQKRLWILHELGGRGDLYNLQSGFRIAGPLDAGALEGALDALVRRHESLRTTFSVGAGGALQIITPSLRVPLERVDLRSTGEQARDEEVRRLSLEDAHRPFDLHQGPLLRATLLRLKEDEHLLLLTIHHAVADGWSLGILARELGALYSAQVRGLPSPLAPLPMQYADFAESQGALVEGRGLDRQLAYWTSALHGLPGALTLPCDYARPLVPSHRGARVRLDLSPELTSALKALSARSRTSLFMTLLAAFKVLLSRTSGQSDVAVGVPVAGRNRREAQHLIGFFLNTVVLRTDLSENIPFVELLQRVRKVCLGAYAHQDLPFEILLEHLETTRGAGRPSLFQVFVNALDFAPPALALDGLVVETFERPDDHSLFDLTLYADPNEESLRLEAMYSVELFSKARIDELLSELRCLLEQVVRDPTRSIRSLDLVTPRARAALPDPAARLEPAWGGSVIERFEARARAHPEREAVVDPTVRVRYGELAAESERLARRLLFAGVQREEVVAVLARRSAHLVTALLGVLKAGAAFLILDTSYPPERLATYVEQASPRAFVALGGAAIPEPLARALDRADLRVRVSFPSDGGAATAPAAVRPPPIGPDDLAYVAFTSGSTGRPKGILGTHRPLSHFIDWHARTFDLGEADRFSMLSALSHDPLLRDIFAPLCAGASLRVPDPALLSDPPRLAAWIASEQITICHLAPVLGELLAEGTRGSELSSLRLVCFGGDVLMQALVDRIAEHAPRARIVSFYGATETPQAMAWFTPSASDAGGGPRPGDACPLGQGIDQVQILVLRPDGGLAGVGEIGEIVVRTPYLARGYLDERGADSAPGRAAFCPDMSYPDTSTRLYWTGDLGRYFPDGDVAFAGRRDHQLKIHGFRVEPREIEIALASHEGVRDAVVTARDDGPEGRHLVAYWTPRRAEEAPRAAALRRHLRQKLPGYMVPDTLVEIDEPPRSVNGKVDRGALVNMPEAFEAPPVSLSPPPRRGIEEELAEIWSEILGVQRIMRRDNFFDLGGNSLLVIRLAVRVREELGRDLPVASLFEVGTLAHLAEAMQSAPTQLSLLVPLRAAGTRPPLFLFHTLRGDAADYYELVSRLDPDQPLYVVRSAGIEPGEEPLTGIEAMASSCLSEIRRVQPEGPYRIGGYSFGGLLAFEAAQQLRARGEEVALLAIFDTGAPRRADQPESDDLPRTEVSLTRGAPVEAFLAVLPFWVRSDPILKEPDPGRRLHVMWCNKLAKSRYRARPYDGAVTYFVARGKFGGLGSLLSRNVHHWTAIAPAIEVREIPGNHGSIFKIPHVESLARELSACLTRVASGPLRARPPPPLPLRERVARVTRRIPIDRSNVVFRMQMWICAHPRFARFIARDPNAYIPTPEEFMTMVEQGQHDR